MATFKKVSTGYKVEICVKGIRKSKTLATKAEGKSWAAQMEHELNQMAGGVSTSHTLGDVFNRYASEVSETKKGAHWEIVRLNMFSRFAIAKVRLVDLRREHFDSYIAERMKTVQSSSVNRELNLISHCLTQARRWRLMAHNPMDDLLRPKNPPPRDRRILQREADAVLLSLNYSEANPVVQQQQRVAVAFQFAIETAMRAGEICSIEAPHIDLANRTVYLPDTKNGSARYVPLSSEAVRLLQRLQPWPDGVPVLGVDSRTLDALFRKGVKRSGVEGLTFHDTRHEAITRLAMKLDVLDLARMVGHKDIKQLMTYYNKSAAELATQLD
jgi:integrase